MNSPRKIDEVEQTYTIREAAKRIGISRPTFYRLLDAGHIRTVRRAGSRVRRIPESELAAWLHGDRDW